MTLRVAIFAIILALTISAVLMEPKIRNGRKHRRGCAKQNATALKGTNIRKAQGNSTRRVNPEKYLRGKIVGLYFSASWCYICHQTTAILKDFYDDVDEDRFEVVFVSRDKSAKDLREYMEYAHGDWAFIPFGDDAIEELTDEYDVFKLPTLIIIQPSGEVITRNGTEEIKKTVPEKLITQWESVCTIPGTNRTK